MKPTINALDQGQLDMMWTFLMMGGQKSNVEALKENCDLLRQAMIQKTAGQRKDGGVSFDDIGTICNCIVIEAMCLYLSGDLDQISPKNHPKVTRSVCPSQTSGATERNF